MKKQTSTFDAERPLENTDIPNIGAPAQRAFYIIGVRCLADITKFSEKELLALHGVGSKAIRILRDTFKEKGLSFANT